MLVVIGHASNSTRSNCSNLIQSTSLTNGAMPTIYAIGMDMDYGHRNGIMPQHFVTTNHHLHGLVDVSSKLGAPLKRTTSTPKHNNNSLVNSSASQSCRRPHPISYNSLYKTQRCHSYSETGYCNYKEKCQFAHGDEELREVPRHPKRKTELCRNFHTTGFCNYGERCDFIHNESIPTSVAAFNQNPWRGGPPMTNHQLQISAPQWSPVGGGGPSTASFRRFTTPNVAPLTIPTLPAAESVGPSCLPYLYQAQSFCGLSSASSNQSCTSCAGSPPPSSTSCDQSPVSYSPDLLTNGGSSPFERHAFYASQQLSPITPVVQQQQFQQGNNHQFNTTGFLPADSDLNTAHQSRCIFTFSSTDSITNDANHRPPGVGCTDKLEDAFELLSPTNPQQQESDDLDPFLTNILRLGNCRLDSLENGNDEIFSDNVFSQEHDQQQQHKSCDESESEISTTNGNRLRTFAWLTSTDRQNGDGISARG